MQEKRLSFLHSLYELTGADRNKTVKLEAIIRKSAISYEDAVGIGQYLRDEELIANPLYPEGKTRTIVKYAGLATPETLDSYRIQWYPKDPICITHKGIKEIEQALNQPDKPTEHFQSMTINNFIQNSGIINSQNVQQNTSNSNQTLILNYSQLEQLEEIINQIKDMIKKEQLTKEEREMLDAETKVLELQAKSFKPKVQRIKESLSATKDILQTISAGATIVAKIMAWLSGIN